MLRRRPIGRTVARTAVIAGTATAVSGHVSRRQQAKSQQAADAEAYQQQQMYEQQAPPPAAAPSPPGAISPEAMEELKQLAALHEQGVLTDEEFATQKARILG